MTSRRVAAVLALAGSLPAFAQVNIGGISFLDRAATGVISIGNLRGGLAVIDVDRDGFMDLVIGDNPGLPTRLFRNVPDPIRLGARTFVDATAGSGLDDADGTARVRGGIIVADVENDGYSDVYMVGRGGTDAGLLYRNNGNGTFSNVSVASGLRSTVAGAQSASWTDVDLDGDVDLLVCHQSPSPVGARLLVNNGAGVFSAAPAGVVPAFAAPGNIYAQGFADYDGDGWADAFICTSTNPPVLLRNVADAAGGRRYESVATAAGFTLLGPAPMGFAAGDIDNDGDLDIGITDAVSGTYYRNDAGTLVRISPFATFFGWGIHWLDAENDGDLDNYQAGSYGGANIDRLTRNLGGAAWDNVSPALNTTSLPSQYSVQLDFNNDGRQDIVTVNPGQFVSVYENVSTAPNHWLTVDLRGIVDRPASVNRDAIGAEIRVWAGGAVRLRQVASGSSYSTSDDRRAHFGLGAATAVDRVEVRWPRMGSIESRTQVLLGPIAVDQVLRVDAACYANCDNSLQPPTLNVVDFVCFLNRFAAADPAANCDGSSTAPVLTVNDFVCFLNRFAAGCL